MERACFKLKMGKKSIVKTHSQLTEIFDISYLKIGVGWRTNK